MSVELHAAWRMVGQDLRRAYGSRVQTHSRAHRGRIDLPLIHRGVMFWFVLVSVSMYSIK